jgi:hypothetical protein
MNSFEDKLSKSFTIQLDESTDSVNLAILFDFVRNVYEGNFRKIRYYADQLKHKQQAKTFFTF